MIDFTHSSFFARSQSGMSRIWCPGQSFATAVSSCLPITNTSSSAAILLVCFVGVEKGSGLFFQPWPRGRRADFCPTDFFPKRQKGVRPLSFSLGHRGREGPIPAPKFFPRPLAFGHRMHILMYTYRNRCVNRGSRSLTIQFRAFNHPDDRATPCAALCRIASEFSLSLLGLLIGCQNPGG